MSKQHLKRESLLLIILLLVSAALFAPFIGKGFVKDDFNWIDSVVKNGASDFSALLTETTGFFRPVVGMSFALQYRFFGLDPFPYGLFNLLLHLANILLIYLLFKKIDRTADYAFPAAALFALNSKANRMAVGWISGRTALLYSFFLLIAFLLHLKGLAEGKQREATGKKKLSEVLCYTGAVFSFFCALLSKESAIAAPALIFAAGNFLSKNGTRKYAFKKAVVTTLFYFPAVVLYFYLRSVSNAFTPADAPSYYRFSLDPLFIFKNIIEYFIRGGLFDLLLLLIVCIIYLILARRKKIKFSKDKLGIIWGGLLFYFIFVLIYLPIPHRSDLYSYFTQIGLHLVFAVLIYDLLLKMKPLTGLTKTVIALFCIGLIIGWTAYLVNKNEIIAKRGITSRQFTSKISAIASMFPDNSFISVYDKNAVSADSPYNSVSYGFPSLLKLLFPLKHLNGEIVKTEGGIEDGKIHYYWEKGSLGKNK